MRRLRWIIAIVVLLSVGGGVGYEVLQANAGKGASPPNIRRVTIDRGDLTLTVNVTGTVAAAQVADLSFDAPGLVADVDVIEGQHVAKGDLLARQDVTAYRLSLAQATAIRHAAQLTLDSLRAPPTPDDLAVATANLKAAQSAYNGLFGAIDPNAISGAQVQLQAAQTAYQDAIQHRRDVGGQFKNDSPTYQLALAQEGQASFAVEAAQLQLQLLQRGVDGRLITAAKAKIAVAQAALDRLRAGALPAELDRAQLAIDQAQLGVDAANQQLASTQLRAPFAGVVSRIMVAAGALSLSTVPAIVLTDTSQLHVRLAVDEIDIGHIAEGQPVSLTLDALPGVSLTGKVSNVAQAADQSATIVSYAVQVALDPSTAPVKVGMTAAASIVVRQLRNVVRVPNLFVRIDRRSGAAFVNLVNADETLTEIPVQLGLRTEEYSEVIDGLSVGDQVGVSLDSTFSILGS